MRPLALRHGVGGVGGRARHQFAPRASAAGRRRPEQQRVGHAAVRAHTEAVLAHARPRVLRLGVV